MFFLDPVRHAILNTEAIPGLTRLLKDRNSRVRCDATHALRLLRGHGAIPWLMIAKPALLTLSQEDARSAIKRASFVDVDKD